MGYTIGRYACIVCHFTPQGYKFNCLSDTDNVIKKSHPNGQNFNLMREMVLLAENIFEIVK